MQRILPKKNRNCEPRQGRDSPVQVLALVPLFFVFARSIADATRQSICRRLTALAESMDCFVADAPRNDDSCYPCRPRRGLLRAKALASSSIFYIVLKKIENRNREPAKRVWRSQDAGAPVPTKAEIATADCIRLASSILCFNINILSKSRGAKRRGDPVQILAPVPTKAEIASPAPRVRKFESGVFPLRAAVSLYG